MIAYRVLLAGAIAALGCGGSAAKSDGGGAAGGSSGAGGNGSCGKVEPCGGDLVGTWSLSTECIDNVILAPQTQSICAQASITSVSIVVSGSLTFGADLSYSSNETGSIVVVWNVPAACLTGETCDYFASMFDSQLPAGETFTCVGSSACTCTDAAMATTTDNGTYAATGSNVVLTSAVTGKPQSGGYCVQGRTLHLVTTDGTMNTGPMGQATIDKDVVAVKQ